MQSLEIRKVQDKKDLRLLCGFMLMQPQSYPNYQEWLYDKLSPRLESGEAEALLAIQDREIIGDVAYQELTTPKTVEIKNLRLDPNYRRRAVGHLLLRHAELEGAAMIGVPPEEVEVITDVSVDNFSGVEFFVRAGYKIVDMGDLYQTGRPEYVLHRTAA